MTFNEQPHNWWLQFKFGSLTIVAAVPVARATFGAISPMAQFGGGPGGMPPGVPPGAEVPEDNDQRGAGVSATAAAGEVSARPPLRRHVRQMQAFLKKFWKEQSIDMEQLEITSEQSFKTHNDLPLARIKRIMKSDEDVRMISARARVKSTRCPLLSTVAAQAEAPVLFAKACELFILELTLRSWCYSEQSKRVHPASHMIRDAARPPADARLRRCARRRIRRGSCARTNRRKTLQKEDISAAIHKTENFDFLVDSVGRSAPPPPPQP